MPLQKQTVVLNIAQPANQKTDPKVLAPGTPTLVENAQFIKGNRLDKRHGYDGLSLTYQDTEYYQDFAYYSGNDLATNSRILVKDDAPGVSLEFTVPRTVGYATFVAELETYLNIIGGTLRIFDKSGVEWLFTYKNSMLIEGSDEFSNVSEIRIYLEIDGLDYVDVLRDGIAFLVADVPGSFVNYALPDYVTEYDLYNPNGMERVDGSALLSDLKGVIGTEDHLLLHSGDNVYSYSKTEDIFRDTGKHIPAETTIISPDETSRPLQGCDCIHVGGVTYYALLEMLSNTSTVKSAYVWVMGIDEATGEVLFNPQECIVNEQTTMKLFEMNGQAYIFYSKSIPSACEIFGRKINSSGIGPEVSLFNDCVQAVTNVAGNFWDVMNLDDTWMVFGYPDDPVFANASIRYFDGDFVEGTGNFAKHTEASNFHDSVSLSMSSSGDRFFYIGSTGQLSFLDYIIINSDGTSNTVSTSFDISSLSLNISTKGGSTTPRIYSGTQGIYLLYSARHNTYTEAYGSVQAHLSDDGTVTKDVTGFKPLFDAQVISKVWLNDGKEFFVFYRNAVDDTCYYFGTIINDALVVTSQILYGRAPDSDSEYEINLVNRNITEISPGVARYAVLAKDSITAMPGCVSPKMDFTSKDLFTGVPYGNSVIIAGSNLHAFGGQNLRELNFWYAPRAPVLADTPADGEITDGSHSIVCVYEYQDKNGYLHRSNPGPETTIVVAAAGAGSIQVTVPNYNNSNMNDEDRYLVKIIPYRTIKDGSLYYRDDYFEKWSGGGATPYIHNNQTGETRTITLKRSDVELATQAVLFTDGGEVPPTPIPPVKYLTSWGSRIWAGGSARDEAIYYSKINQTNLMPEFSELFSTSIQDKPGRTTGLIGLSDKIIMSKRGRLYYAFGNGPDNLGINGTFSSFEEIPGVSGAVNGKSMVVNRTGVNFKSDKGLYNLTPGLDTQYSGAIYEDSADEEIIKSITPIDSETIRFVTGTGIIAFNTYFGAWSKDSSSKLLPIDACLYDNQFYVLTSDSLLRENMNKWTDDTTSYDYSVETGWMSFAGIAGFQRFYKMFMVMDNFTAYTVTVSLAYDYGDYVDSTTFTNSTDSRIIIYPSKQKCEAFRFKIEVTANGDTEQSLNINFIGIVAGTKVGLPKQLPVSQRIGTTNN
jgi:hypothetical protein